MPLRLQRLLLMVLLMVLPLQGMASAIHALACTPESGHASMAAADHSHAGEHGHAAHDRGAPHQHPAGTGDSDHASHQCCHHFSSAAVPSLANPAHADLPVFISSISLLETLFFPEQPQRPPRG